MRIDTPPVINGETHRLRPLEARDVDAWYGYMSQPALLDHTSWSLCGPDDLRAVIDDCASDRRDSPLRFAVIDSASDRLVGTIGFPTVSTRHGTAEVAYDFDPTVRGRGIATACCRAVTTWALQERGFVRVQGTTLDSNAASRRVLEKCGFAFEGLLMNLKRVRGEPRAFNLFSKTAAR